MIAEVDWTAIVVALVGGLALVGAAGAPAYFSSRKAIRKVEEVHSQVLPSNGTKLASIIERTEVKVDSLASSVRQLNDGFLDHLQRPDAHHKQER